MRVWKALLALLLCLATFSACGPQVDLVEKPARDMNLAEADMEGYTLSAEEDLELLRLSMDLPEDEDLQDANMRMFETGNGYVVAVVFVLNRPVRGSELDDLADGFEEGVASEIPGTTLESLAPPALGEGATMTGAEMPDLGVAMYFLGFREVNVVGVVSVVGMSDMATEEFAVQLGQKIFGKVTR